MISQFFRAHGHFCASHPWEVIIGTLIFAVCVMSMNLFAGNRKICGWNVRCVVKDDDSESFDMVILVLTRCLAVLYLYLQFHKLRWLGSRYILGIVSLFTLFTGFVFSVAFANVLGSDLTALNQAFPFLLLLIDLSKACMMAKLALGSSSQDEVVDNIANGMEVIGPMMTLDAAVETLVIGIGMLSGVKTLETTCCLGCLSVVANFIAFIVFYPAFLALVLDLTYGSRPLIRIRQLSGLWEEGEDEEDVKPNPVAQRVKVIMCAGLVFVYGHSRLVVAADDGHMENKLNGLPDVLSKVILPDVPVWRFYLTEISSMGIDFALMLMLGVILLFKYILFDLDKLRICKGVTMCDDDDNSGNEIINRTRGLLVESKDAAESIVCLVETQGFVGDKLGSLQMNVESGNNGESMEVGKKDQIELKEMNDVRNKGPSSGRLFILGDSSDEEGGEPNHRLISVGTQTEEVNLDLTNNRISRFHEIPTAARALEQCRAILKCEDGSKCLTDEEVLLLVNSKDIPAYKLESVLQNHERGVSIRRHTIKKYFHDANALEKLPFSNYDYKYVDGACCENVIGYVPIPVGYAGPLLVNGKHYVVPMATTEGCLVASTNRGCRALSSGTGVMATVTHDGMSRAPIVRFVTAKRSSEVKAWLENRDNYDLIAEVFDGTSRFARLKNLTVFQVARNLYIRFTAITGDAMGMNMLSKGTEKVLNILQEKFFPDMEIVSLSGNFCTDKKPSAVNWIEGRGKSVVAEAIVSKEIVQNVLKTSVSALVDLNVNKNLIGSAAAGSIGGFNAHSANIVTAIYIATGQDPAQNVCSSNCITIMELAGPENEDLYISCTMPSIEVGTIGGGTVLPPQASCLDMLGVRGPNKENPGLNAVTLATVVCASVMAGELSLMSALAAGHLVKSHMKHNRSVLNISQNDGKLLSDSTGENGFFIPVQPTS